MRNTERGSPAVKWLVTVWASSKGWLWGHLLLWPFPEGNWTKWNKDFILQIVLYTIIFLKFLLRGFLNETPTAFSVIPFLLATWNHDNSTTNEQKNPIQPAKLCWLKSTRENHNKSPTCQLKTALQINHFVLWEKDLCVICSHHWVQQLRGRWVRKLF